MARIIVAGYMLRLPFMGNMLAYAQYVVGLQRLGHDVVYVEESGWPGACFNLETGTYSDDPDYGLASAQRLLDQLGGTDIPLWYLNRETGETNSDSKAKLDDVITGADLLINVGGVCWIDAFEHVPCRALIDMDPMFMQAGLFGKEGFAAYNSFFTYGTNVGGSGCTVPTLGVRWRPTVPPVLADFWQQARQGVTQTDPSLTTLANWSAYGGVEFEGAFYGQKDRQFEAVMSLPSRVQMPLTLYVSGMPKDKQQQFRDAGWQVLPPGELNHSLDAYRSFIAGSLGEFSVAKHGYVVSRCGWISDRSVCYLAAGRPIVVQDTGDKGFSQMAAGVLLFNDTQDSAEQIQRLAEDYDAHAAAAALAARERFNYAHVLPRLIEQAMSVRVD